MLLSMPRPRHGKEIAMLEEARALRNRAPHLYAQTPHNTLDGMNSDTLDRVLKEVSLDFNSFTV